METLINAVFHSLSEYCCIWKFQQLLWGNKALSVLCWQAYKTRARTTRDQSKGMEYSSSHSLPVEIPAAKLALESKERYEDRLTLDLVLRDWSLLPSLIPSLCGITSTAALLSPITTSPRHVFFVAKTPAMQWYGEGEPPKPCLGLGTRHDSSAWSDPPPPSSPRTVSRWPLRWCRAPSTPSPVLSERRAEQWPAPAAWPAQLNAEQKMLGQQQQGCLPTEDGFDTFASRANQSGTPWRWAMMDVAIPSTSRFVFSFFLFFNKHSLFAVCVFRNNLHCSGPIHWLCKTRLKLKLHTIQCGAFPKALTFLLLLSSKMLTAYLAGLTTAEFCLHVCQIFILAGKKTRSV